MKSVRNLRHQQGAILAITLILLLVVTIIGVTTMSSSSVQTFLARNTQLKQVSFQNAESSAIVGEAEWDAALTACLNDIANCTTNIAPAVLADVSSIDWDTAIEAKNDDDSVTYGKYVVEYLGWRPVEGESDKILRIYRFTARGLGPNDKATTRVQTVFRKCVKTDGLTCPNS